MTVKEVDRINSNEFMAIAAVREDTDRKRVSKIHHSEVRSVRTRTVDVAKG